MAQLKSTPRGVFTATMILAVVILVPSLLGFVNKLVEFGHVASGEADGAFAITPIMNYTLATLGFLCLLIWATYQGMFHDIEAPKHTMLEREEELDIHEPNYIPAWAGGRRLPDGR